MRCEGDRVVLQVNGLVTADYREEDPAIPRKGILALQIHGGGPMEGRFADVQIRELGGGK